MGGVQLVSKANPYKFVLSFFLNNGRLVMVRKSVGNWFQTSGAAVRKAFSACTVLEGGTLRRDLFEDLRVLVGL